MFNKIKENVYEANLELCRKNLVILTWGNVSERLDKNTIVIKPSGIEYTTMKPKDMVVLDLNGNILEGEYKPSSDTPTHIELYKAYPEIKGICHTHSTYATSFAQAGTSIKALGTTHSDYFYGEIPCTRDLNEFEVITNYETNTGKVIIETFKNKKIMEVPGCIVHSHGVFTWGHSSMQAVENAFVLEEIAKINFLTLSINPHALLSEYIVDKHYQRKHGVNAYYGQKI